MRDYKDYVMSRREIQELKENPWRKVLIISVVVNMLLAALVGYMYVSNVANELKQNNEKLYVEVNSN